MGAQIPLFDDEPGQPTLRDLAEAVRTAGVDGLPSAVRRADQARYQEVSVKSALTRVQGMPFEWALNPYRGCTHACEYCYARKYQRHLDLGAGDDFSSVILVKTNVARMLAREVAKPSWSRAPVAVGTATDAYQPIEGHYRVTRACLEVLADARTPLTVVTKGPLVVRDVDILARGTAGAGARVYLSVACVDPVTSALLEPGAAAPEQRLRAARTLAEAGIDVAVLMMPLVPGLTTTRTRVEETITAIARAGLRVAGLSVAHLEAGVRDHFFGFLARERPDLLAGYRRLYAGARPPRAYAEAVQAAARQARDRIRLASSGSPPTNDF